MRKRAGVLRGSSGAQAENDNPCKKKRRTVLKLSGRQRHSKPRLWIVSISIEFTSRRRVAWRSGGAPLQEDRGKWWQSESQRITTALPGVFSDRKSTRLNSSHT